MWLIINAIQIKFTLQSIAIISDYITAAIAEGLAERQAAKDEEGVDEMSDDEKEKKAARLEAEAQAEGGRGGRGGRGAGGQGAGGGQPKRRMPSTQRRPSSGGGGGR